jgi:hypothetical protein
VIQEVCDAADRRKEFRIIFPSIFNNDLVTRAREAGRNPDEVVTTLSDWYETLAKLAQTLAPRHFLELRTTMEPHRYHAIFTESQCIFGIPWHRKASLTTSSYCAGEDTPAVISEFHEDFAKFYSTCEVYKPGDNAKSREKAAPRKVEEPFLLKFGRTLPWVIQVLQYIGSSFPDANGNGATKHHLQAKFNMDESLANKRLLEMEEAGLVRRLGERREKDARHGRVITEVGEYYAKKYRLHSPDMLR